MNAQDALRQSLGQRLSFRDRLPGVSQIIAPIFYEDGDMIDLFLDTRANTPNRIRITDSGLTLMKLSYTFDIDTSNKQRLFERILSENQVTFEGGEIYVDSSPEDLGISLLHLSQVIAKVSSLQYLKRQVISNLFYEQLGEFITKDLARFDPKPQYAPLTDRPELEADWVFPLGQRPLYLFGVRDSSKARLSAISCLEFQRRDIAFRSVIVHEDFEALRKKDQSIITNASDKQFASLRAFIEDGRKYFDREAA
ncbi:DUF1828 domain-containing protein [Granulicella sp. 5B5]|uniref:DUF1828 domain-containing protein n=1 Tax=Granulicella sp. 5B5 TaxID=1617967 RepID=UPI0015F66693|nr:DUF1828 domain-containing protein [Granulicella sp. 5B5]QMV19332.1 DUF1828 domain-containing protein [Granulicella sp. 5B5]